MHPTDPDEGLELRPEVAEQLNRSLDAPRSSLLSADEMRAKFWRKRREARYQKRQEKHRKYVEKRGKL